MDRVSISDSFFDLGGNSLMAVRLLWGIRDATGVDIPIQELYQNPTIGELSKVLGGAGEAVTGRNEKTMAQITADLKSADDVRDGGAVARRRAPPHRHARAVRRP